MPLTGRYLDFRNMTEKRGSLCSRVAVVVGRWSRCPCSHRYLVRGASYTCHLFDVTVATGAEGGSLGTGVAVHLPINFHGLSERKEENRQDYSTQSAKRDSTANQTIRGCGGVQISRHNSFKRQKQNSNMDDYLKVDSLVKQKAWKC